MISKFLFIFAGYISGSIPFGLVYSKLFEEDDVREQGSGNIGATNIIRNFGWTPGIITLILDAAKGGVPAYLSYTVFQTAGFDWLWMCVGGAAILGHIYPIFLKFSGGKGVATSTGVFLVLAPKAVGVSFIVFAIGVGLTRFMSVGSLLGALALPASLCYFQGYTDPITIGGGVLALMVYWQHQENIKRLWRGEENKFF